MPLVWVIGSRGLLGRAICRAVRARPGWTLCDAEPLPWAEDTRMAEVARRNTRALLERSGAETLRCAGSPSANPVDARSGFDWAIVWAAGAAVTSSPVSQLDHEHTQLQLVLDAIAAELALVSGARSDPPHSEPTVESRQTPSPARGVFFYASSAGGVYGGSIHPPFTEETVPVPLAGYGRFKLGAEQAITAFSRGSDTPALIGRIANLYGPGQSMAKLQGVISHLARAELTRAPMAIYVPLDTMRDYIYVDDCAALICAGLERLASEPHDALSKTVVKNLVSGSAVTIGSLLGAFRVLGKRKPNVTLGASSLAAAQAVDLRLASIVWPELDARPQTPLPVGIQATLAEMQAKIQAGPRQSP
ncbi:NAD(P)-dependent oxidoreductase [Homoserinimonas sp. OAct 916]|uniref:NAD-dependent epimerase/dehydratase family protein n=1 Tax=Homoserinimonas sp. OAct 916 TaxID=2211450 RepID=UPI000DBEA501|nr:NAD(P)-dependent oxidoreductase [Homoserinimonas sp. OAct 916]